ncbi:MAG: hypothetical protein MK212_10565 [Saprospiraceae bacterium]|nr:hypothetical protein [Saprospiraceae bacterium]
MYSRYYFLLLFFLSLGKQVFAQQDRLKIKPKDIDKMRLELDFSAGVSFPMGTYKALDFLSSRNGSAQYGFYGEFALKHRFQRSPLWSLSAKAGFMRHGFNTTAIINQFDVRSMEGRPWSIFYVMPGAYFEIGKKFKLNLGISLGAIIYNGWNAKVGLEEKIGLLETKEWSYQWRATGGVNLDLELSYRFSSRISLFLRGGVLYASGSRTGNLREEKFTLDLNDQPVLPAISSQDFLVLQKTLIFTIHTGIGFKYRLYKYLKDPNLELNDRIEL